MVWLKIQDTLVLGPALRYGSKSTRVNCVSVGRSCETVLEDLRLSARSSPLSSGSPSPGSGPDPRSPVRYRTVLGFTPGVMSTFLARLSPISKQNNASSPTVIGKACPLRPDDWCFWCLACSVIPLLWRYGQRTV